jgi:hypothetical protein
MLSRASGRSRQHARRIGRVAQHLGIVEQVPVPLAMFRKAPRTRACAAVIPSASRTTIAEAQSSPSFKPLRQPTRWWPSTTILPPSQRLPDEDLLREKRVPLLDALQRIGDAASSPPTCIASAPRWS